MDYEKTIIDLIGKEKYNVFLAIKDYIENNYDMDEIFKEQNIKTKKWKYELKFSKSKKTFCGFYFADNCLGVMIIFGKEERNRVEDLRKELSNELLTLYDSTETYHDGKWLMLELDDMSLLDDIKKLLAVKRKPKNSIN